MPEPCAGNAARSGCPGRSCPFLAQERTPCQQCPVGAAGFRARRWDRPSRIRTPTLPLESKLCYGGAMSFWREMSKPERATFRACFGGWALDGMDFQFYSFIIPTLIAGWHLTKAQAGTLQTSTLLASALGGWLAGLIADRIGRVRTLQITILWFALFTGLCGLAQSYGQLLAARALMGLGFGGEWAAGAVLMGEVIAARHRGKAVGAVQSGWALGWGAAAILYTIAFSVLPEQTAWRVLFLAGVLPSLLVLYIRRNVEEPAVFRAARESGTQGRFWEIFAPEMAPTTLLAALLATGA